MLARGTGADEATVLTRPALRTTAWDAAFLNGAASHSLDFDDLHNPSIIHLASVVVPPVLALAEAEEKSGREIIAAVTVGYEIGARVGESIIPESYHYWHTTGTAGIFGGAAAAGNLLHLDREEMVQCLGTAGTQAAGLWEFLVDGAMSKSLHIGKACYGAVLSAYLTKDGFTGAKRILEGEKGFCGALSPNPHWDKLTNGLGNGSFKIDDNSFKPYACCKHSHAAISAAISLREEYPTIDAEKIIIRVNEITDNLINNPAPQNAYGCKFSIQYCVATALLYGDVGVDRFTDEAIHDIKVRELMECIEVVRDPKMEAIKRADPSKLASCVEITMRDGKFGKCLVEYPKGDPANTLTIAELRDKYDSLAIPVLGSARANQLAEMLLNLEDITCPYRNIKEIMFKG